MSGQNTQKQILAMVALMMLGIIGLGAYVWFDDGRRAEAEDEQVVLAAERGANLFANNCRVCHGNTGLGRNGDPSLVGPALNTPVNTLDWRTDNAGGLGQKQLRFSNTIACGRNRTAMPPWAIAEGGSLNFSKIENLVALITTNAGNAWEIALERALEQDEIALAGLESAIKDAEATGDQDRIADARKIYEEAKDRVERGLPIQQALISSPTDGTCGQIERGDGGGAAASAAPSDSDVPDIDSSGFSADAAHGEELFFSNGCSACHGSTGEGGIGPTIAGTDLSFSQVVSQYRNPRDLMPPFSASAVPDEDVFDIYSWLQTLE